MSVIERKAGCAKEFTELLAQKLGSRLVKVVLFGSVAKGFADASSDVDVLVVVDRVSDDVRSAVAEVAFDVSVRFGEPIEYIVMGLEEYRAKSLDNPFIYEVERFGRVLYHDPKPEEEMVKKLLRLADEYYSYAVKCAQQLMYRPAIDLSQNAVELLLKALILAIALDRALALNTSTSNSGSSFVVLAKSVENLKAILNELRFSIQSIQVAMSLLEWSILLRFTIDRFRCEHIDSDGFCTLRILPLLVPELKLKEVETPSGKRYRTNVYEHKLICAFCPFYRPRSESRWSILRM
jgi:predicted nucleotidyltransferase